MAGTQQEQGPESLDSTLATVMELAAQYVTANAIAFELEHTNEPEEARKPFYETEKASWQELLEACHGDEGIATLATLAAGYTHDLQEALTKAYSL